jgi:hypothetical protein
MVNQINVWKTKFYKNNTAECGAMKVAINNSKNTDVIIHSHTVKHGRMWAFVNPNQLLKLIEKNKGIYETITKYPHKVYFDIDCPKYDDSLLQKIKTIINKYFINADMAISGSVCNVKTSYHIVLQNYHINNENERLTIKSIVKYLNKNEDESFDWKVYTNNRNMKCINQSKPNKPIQSIIENDDYKTHCITCFINSVSLPIPINEHIEHEILIEKSTKTFNLGILPKLNLTTPDTIDIYECSSLELLKLLPINEKHPHEYTHLIARFCYHNKINFEIFFSWYSNKNNNNENKIKWINHWAKLEQFPTVSNEKIIEILSNTYSEIKKDLPYRLFKKTFDLPDKKIKKIETITQDCFDDESKYLLFNIGMGGGKTFQTIEYLQSEQNFLWIAPNIALSNNTKQRFEENKMNSVKHYLGFSKKDKAGGFLSGTKQLIIVLNSLHYMANSNFDVIVIDEIETLLDKLLGDFMEQGKLQLKQESYIS